LGHSIINKLESRLGYCFKSSEIAFEALTHPSYQHESISSGQADYQRLEFLGDAVLGMLLAELLFLRFPDKKEGELSKFRSQIADQRTLAGIARKAGLGELILLGRGEMLDMGWEKESILADVLEALLGAIYMDGGIDAARRVIASLFEKPASLLGCSVKNKDSKSELQELLSSKNMQPPVYTLIEESGPPHERKFRFRLSIENGIKTEGRGNTKKAAQQAAAAKALEILLYDKK